MPFNGSGTYSLPQAPFVSGTIIDPAAVNSDLADIGLALTTTQTGLLAITASQVLGFQDRTDAVAASIPANVNYILTQGYAAPGDCDGLSLLYIRGTTPTQGSFISADGQTWILQNKNPHVGMFGAKGDGATDDSIAILNAIAFVKTNNISGGTIWFSPKIYAVGTTITIGDGGVGAAATYNGIVLASMAGVGASAQEFTANDQGATLKWIGAANGTLVSIQGPITSCGLTNICLNGNVTCSTTLSLTHSYKGRFENVLITKYSQNNSTDVGLGITSRATFGAVTVTGDENVFINVQVEDAGNSTGVALDVLGSNRNSFYRCLFAIPGTGTGVNIQSTASLSAKWNSFTGLKVPQQNTGTGTAFVTIDGGAGLTDVSYQHFNTYSTPMWNGQFVVTAAAGALTVALKTLSGDDPSGSDPVFVAFRDVTGTAGDYFVRPVTGATSVVAASGSTYAVTSAKAFRLWVVGFNDGGTFRLGLTQLVSARSGTAAFAHAPLADYAVASSTQDSGAAGSSGVIYTTGTAVSSKAMRILGFVEWNATGLTAGTWTTTNLSTVQLFGPGVARPGDVIQRSGFTGTVNNSTNSTTFQASATMRATLTPTSAANIIRCSSGASGTDDTANDAGIFQISRGTTNNTNMFGSISTVSSSAGSVNGTVACIGFDFPNTTSSTTYTQQYKSSTGAGNAALGASGAATIEAAEIMA